MDTHHYVYRSYEEGGRDYIGRRTCNCMPEKDTKYLGSFRDKTFNPTGKTILFVCETREEAADIEIELHDFFDVAVNPQFANMAKATSTWFDRTGVPQTEEAKKKLSVAMSGENNPNYGNTGALHRSSKAILVIEPDGTQRHYGSIIEAARELEIHHGDLCKYSKPGKQQKQGKWKGWQFICENP